MDDATVVLDAQARRQLARVYLFLVSLNKRREQQAADRGSLDSEPQPTAEGASDKAERGSSVQ